MTLEANTETDLLIVGAGIAGCITAISLADRYKVTLIDQLPEPVNRIGESLAPAAQRILKQLHLFEDLDSFAEHQLYIQNLGMQSYWGSDRVQIVDHLRNPDGPGHNLNRKAFESHLRKKAVEKGVRCMWPVTFHSSSYDNSLWQVITKANNNQIGKKHRITARFVADATGRQSRFTRSLGIKRDHYDKLITCWATMADCKENKMSTISAGELGWWYSAMVPDNKRVLAFQTDSDLIDRRTVTNAESFISLATGNEAMKNIIEKANGPLLFHGNVSANSTRLAQVAGKQWVALGDAAVSFDPLSSQGMFHAMAGAMQFTELIIKYNCITVLDDQKMKRFQYLYTRQIDQIWKHYLHHKAIYYRAEVRWPKSLFWRRRH